MFMLVSWFGLTLPLLNAADWFRLIRLLKRLFVSSHLSEGIYVWCYCWRYCFCSCWWRHAYSIVIGSKHITLNATGGGFLTASKQFRHGATSKSRSNTASNSTKHKSPHLSGWRQDRKSVV